MDNMKRKMFSLVSLSILICLTFGIPQSSMAQTSNGQITGIVTDSSGASVPGVDIKVINTATNVTTQTETNASGIYLVPQLVPGSYKISLTKEGFKVIEQSNVTVRTGDHLSMNFALTVGEVKTEVSVSSEAPLLTTADATNSNVIDNSLITQLPQLGRNGLDLLNYTPSVQGGGPQQLGNGFDYGVGLTGSTYSLAGGQPNGTVVSVDGATMNEQDSNVINRAIPTPDSVGEMRVQTGVLTADTGRYSGGVVSISTLGGTNEFHGKVFEYYRSQAMNSNSWYNNNHNIDRASFHQNNFGAAVGGPIRIPKLYNGKDHTFFFFAYEGERYKTGSTAQTSVPTEEEKKGIFTNSIAHYDENGNPVKMRIFDPFRGNTDSNGNWVRPEFPNAVIPEQYQSATALKYMQLYPKANHAPLFNTSNQNNYWAPSTYSKPYDRINARLDENLTNNQRLNFRISRYNATSATSAPFQFGTATSSNDLNWSGSLQYVWSPTSSSVLEARLGLASSNLLIHQGSDPDPSIDSDTFGFDPRIFVNRKSKQILPWLFPWGGASAQLGGSYDDRITSQNFNADLAYTKIWGRHTLKTGFQYYQSRLSEDGGDLSGVDRVYATGGTRELWNENNNTGYDLADLMTGAMSMGTYGLFNVAPYMSSWAVYLMDDWKVNNKLTMQMGLRIDHNGPKRVRYPKTGVVWDFNAKNVLKPNADWSWNQVLTSVPELSNLPQPGWLTSGVNGRVALRGSSEYPGDVIFETDAAVVQPRLGISYALNPKTVLHASGGIIYQGLNGMSFDDAGNCYYGRDIFQTIPTLDGKHWVSELGMDHGLGAFPAQPDGSALGFYPAAKTNQDYWYLTYGSNPSPASGVADIIGSYQRSPQEYTWGLSLQRELSRSWVVSAEYTGIRGIHMAQPVTSYKFSNVSPEYYSLGSKLYDQVPNPFYGQSQTFSGQPTITLYHLLSQMPQYNVAGLRSATWGHMKAHYLNLQIQTRGYHGLTLLASYSIRKTITTSGAKDSRNGGIFTGGLQDPNNIEEAYGVATYEIPQALLMNYSYELPVGRGKHFLGSPSSFGAKVLDQVIGGWALAGTTNWWPNGRPVAAPYVPNYNTAPNAAVRYSVKPGVDYKNPNFDPASALIVDNAYVSSTPSIAFNPNAFVLTPDYSLGNLPKYYPNLRQPGGFTTDATVMKNFYFSDSHKRYLNIRIEAVNFFNHPLMGNIDNQPNSVTFGGIQGKNGNRIMQLGARIFF